MPLFGISNKSEMPYLQYVPKMLETRSFGLRFSVGRLQALLLSKSRSRLSPAQLAYAENLHPHRYADEAVLWRAQDRRCLAGPAGRSAGVLREVGYFCSRDHPRASFCMFFSWQI